MLCLRSVNTVLSKWVCGDFFKDINFLYCFPPFSWFLFPTRLMYNPDGKVLHCLSPLQPRYISASVITNLNRNNITSITAQDEPPTRTILRAAPVVCLWGLRWLRQGVGQVPEPDSHYADQTAAPHHCLHGNRTEEHSPGHPWHTAWPYLHPRVGGPNYWSHVYR